MFRGLALQNPHDIICGSGVDLHLVIHHQRSSHRSSLHFFLQFLRICQADRQGWNGGGAADVLTIQSIVRNLGKATHIRRQNSHRTLKVRLQHGVGDPPVGPLIYIHQDDLSLYIQVLIVPRGALSGIDYLGGNPLRGR